MKNYVLILGWARGGTTLMKNLFSCFKDTWLSSLGEGDSRRFLLEGAPSEVAESNIVLKCHYNQFDRDGLFQARELCGGKIIFLIRDPRDTVASNLNTGSTWNDLQNNCALVCEVIDEIEPLLIRYEDLCSSPDEAQQKIADYYSLEIIHPFSRGNERYRSEEEDHHVTSMRGGFGKDPFRPIDTGGIGQYATCSGIEQVEEVAATPEVAAFIERFYA